MRAEVATYDMVSPGSLQDALRLLGPSPDHYRPFAGGTDLMVLYAAGRLGPRRFVNLWRLDELRGIEVSDDAVTLGALTTYSEVQSAPVLEHEFPMLIAAARETGGLAIQNRGTLGGNIANASPAADSPPALLCYGAELELRSLAGARWVPYDRFHTGYKQTVLREDELISRIRLPRGPGERRHFYHKVGPRRAQAISKVCFAGCADLRDGVVCGVRIALGGVAPVVLRLPRTEALIQQAAGAPDPAAVNALLGGEIAPIDDVRSTARYRRRVAENLLGAFLVSLREARYMSGPHGTGIARGRGLPLYVRILLGVFFGALLGLVLPGPARLLGEIGLLVIRLLKALATPLILFAVLDSFLRTRIQARRGLQLVLISAANAAVATAIGLGVANVLHTGQSMGAHFRALAGAPATAPVPPELATLDPLKNFAAHVPESLIEPFAKNSVITVVLLAVLVGVALRRLKDRTPDGDPGMRTLESLIGIGLLVFTQMLEWLIWLIPFAVFGVIANVVSRTGLVIFRSLGIFLGTILLGLFIHVGAYYSLVLVVLGRTSPRRFFTGAADAILTALSAGSSLATLPVTLRSLTERMGVSQESARLAACVGTNLNHDGIILYEACAAVFVAQAFGHDLGVGQQMAIALAAIMAGIGIAGVPEAGLITLPLVLAAAKLPEAVAATAIPLILPVDWIIGRFRAATNVTSDMTVAVVLDRWAGPPPPPE